MQAPNMSFDSKETSTKPPSVEMVYIDQQGSDVELKYENSFKIHSIYLSE